MDHTDGARLAAPSRHVGFGDVVRGSPAWGFAVDSRVYPIGPVIEGYSVDEAASVLGVPKGRVWELLARGILAGTPEDGGGMRVYLQGRPMEPIVGRPLEGRPEEPAARPAGANGNGGEHGQPGFEASPFRELLTEFRNLTERYGQALLALGEARGEVASLRTRVELLEARVDLRLPSAPPLVQWTPPPQQPIPQEPEAPRERIAQPPPEPMAEAAADQSQAGDEHETASDDSDSSIVAASVEEEPISSDEEAPTPAIEAEQLPAQAPVPKRPRPRRRRQSARSATKGFSEALARAQDPTVSQLPGGDETQAAFNELRERIRRESLTGEASEPAGALADEAEGAMGLGEIAAPAEEVDLDSLRADDELGGGMDEATAIEPAALEEVEPMQEAELGIPGESAISVEPVSAAVEAEPDEPPKDIQVLGPEPIDHEQENPPAEPIEQTVDAAPTYSHEWDEPDWIAEEDVDWGVGEPEVSREPVAMGESPEIGWDELPAATGGVPAEQTEPVEVREDQDADEGTGPSEPLAISADPESTASPSPEASESHAIAVEALGSQSGRDTDVEEPTGAKDDQPPDAVSMSAQSSEEELMWLGDEFRAGPAAWSAPGRATTIPRPMTPTAEATVSAAEDEALARLAVERGWDDEELHAIRSLLAQPVRTALDGTQQDQTRSDAMATGLPEVLPRGPEARPRAETRIGEAGDATAGSTDAVDAEAREEEAFDWEQGPSAWSPPPTARASLELPGAMEVDQAMAAFEVGAWSKEGAAHDGPRSSDEPATADTASYAAEQPPEDAPEPPAAQPAPASNVTRQDEADTATWSDATRSAPPAARQAAPLVNPAELSGGGDEDWLRGRRGPAANAYRRLRRLFP